MTDDADVARVAAALNAPGLRYRSFNNAPVRVYSAAPREQLAAELPLETFDPPPVVAAPAAPAIVAPPVAYAPPPVEPPLARDQDFEYAASEEPLLRETRLETEHAFYPEPAPFRAAPEPAEPEPEPVPLPPASVPLFSWPEVSPAAPLAPELPSASTEQPASLPRIAPAPPAYAAPEPAALPVTMAPAQASAPDYRLFNAIGRLSDTPPPPSQPQAANTTLAMLRSRIESAPATPLPFQGVAPPPPAAAAPTPPTLLPAGAVTVPLSDVMRLIAAGASPPASPFEAFRSALSAQPPR